MPDACLPLPAAVIQESRPLPPSGCGAPCAPDAGTALERLRSAITLEEAGAGPGGGRAGAEVRPDRTLLEAMLLAACLSGAEMIRVESGTADAPIRVRIDGRESDIARCAGPSGAVILAGVLQLAGLGPMPFEGGCLQGEFAWPAPSPALPGAPAPLGAWRFDFSVTAQGAGRHALRIGIAPRRPWLPSLDQLGFEARDLETLVRVLRQPQGLIFIAGGRASGRSTTAYAMLERIDAGVRSVQTLESAILRPTPGWQQFRAAASDGTGGIGLAQVLRNAPDVLLLDAACSPPQWPDHARLVADAVAGGCLVLAPVAGERAHHPLARLLAAGLARRECAAHLALLIAQRLVRRLCTACARPDDSVETREALARAANSWLGGRDLRCARPGSRECAHCHGSGYHGRAMVYEMLQVEAGARAMFEEGVGDRELEQRLLSEGRGIWDHGLRLVARGETTLQALRESLCEPG